MPGAYAPSQDSVNTEETYVRISDFSGAQTFSSALVGSGREADKNASAPICKAVDVVKI